MSVFRTVLTHCSESVHWGLVMLIPCLVAFQTLMNAQWSLLPTEMQTETAGVEYLLRLEPGLSESANNRIVATVEALDPVIQVDFEKPVPAWDGDPALEETWQELWSSNLSPFVVATVSAEGTTVEEISFLLESIEGVMSLTPPETLTTGTPLVRLNRQVQDLFSLLFLFVMAGTVGASLWMYPVRFRRDVAVRIGQSGAGAYVNPERVLAGWVGINGGACVFVYLVLAAAGFLVLHRQLNPTEAGIMMSLLQGTAITFLLTGAIMVIGWWLPSREVDMMQMLHPSTME